MYFSWLDSACVLHSPFFRCRNELAWIEKLDCVLQLAVKKCSDEEEKHVRQPSTHQRHGMTLALRTLTSL